MIVYIKVASAYFQGRGTTGFPHGLRCCLQWTSKSIDLSPIQNLWHLNNLEQIYPEAWTKITQNHSWTMCYTGAYIRPNDLVCTSCYCCKDDSTKYSNFLTWPNAGQHCCLASPGLEVWIPPPICECGFLLVSHGFLLGTLQSLNCPLSVIERAWLFFFVGTLTSQNALSTTRSAYNEHVNVITGSWGNRRRWPGWGQPTQH